MRVLESVLAPSPAALDDLLTRCRDLVEDVSFAAVQRWREDHPGAGVVGHFQVYFPEELAWALGMLPVTVAGAGDRVEARRADARIGSFVCSICRTSLELGLAGRLDFLAAFITHPICDAARHMAGLWGRNMPGTLAQILYLPQNANSRYAAAYLAGEYRRLLGELERLAGRRASDDDLWRAIALYNENRRLIRELYAVRRETPWLLSASESYALVRAGTVLPKDEHNDILRQALGLLPGRGGRRQDKIRVVFEGGFCEQPPLDMLATIEDACYVVDDDLMIGTHFILEDVPSGGDPLLALAESYLERSSYSPVQHDLRKPKETMLLARLQAARAQAAILAAAKMCEPGMDEQVAYQRALEDRGIPFLLLEFEEKMTAFEQLRMQVETFAESILFE